MLDFGCYWINFNTVCITGKILIIAPNQHDKHFKEDVKAYVDDIIQGLPATKQRLEKISLAQENDQLCQVVT